MGKVVWCKWIIFLLLLIILMMGMGQVYIPTFKYKEDIQYCANHSLILLEIKGGTSTIYPESIVCAKVVENEIIYKKEFLIGGKLK